MTNFTNKTEYMAFRANWKARYKELSQEIRETRVAIRSNTHSQSRTSLLQSEKSSLRKQAHKMMIELFEAKIEAQRQWEAANTEKAAA